MEDADQLLADAQAGNPDWDAIYRMVRLPMYRAVWRVLRPHRSYAGVCDDDIVATAFDELRKKQLDAVRSLVGVARITAYRRALDVVRRPSWEVPCASFDDSANDEDLADDLRRKDELCNRVMRWAELLPDHQRVALQETVLNQRSVKEVAGQDLGGVSTQAVYELRRKAILNINKHLHGPEIP